MNRLPQTSTDITPEWLTAALREGGQVGPVEVTSVQVETLAAGVGFMGEVTRLHVSYQSPTPGAPSTLIAKIPTQSPEVRAMMAPARVYEREGRFYQALSDQPDLPAPRCYFSGVEVEADEFLLLLEDLSQMRCGDQLAACSPDDAAAALRCMAAFHAAYWDNDALAALDWLPAINSEMNKVAGENIYATTLPQFLEVFGATLTDEMADIAQVFATNTSHLLDLLFDMPHTLVHFDYRLDNIFFDPAADVPVKLIDFQAVARGGGAYDLGYFLSQSLTIEDRRAHEAELLDIYHGELTARGVEYPRAQMDQDLRVGMMYGWIIPVFAVGGLDFSSERAIRLWTEVVARSQAAIADHGASEFLRR